MFETLDLLKKIEVTLYIAHNYARSQVSLQQSLGDKKIMVKYQHSLKALYKGKNWVKYVNLTQFGPCVGMDNSFLARGKVILKDHMARLRQERCDVVEVPLSQSNTQSKQISLRERLLV